MQQTILYADDDSDDIEFLSLEIRKQRPEAQIVGAINGREALTYLDNAKAGLQNMPCVIVLDLNMPLLSGRETFEELQKDVQTKDVPVVILTTSHNPHDKAYFNNRGIAFFIKPDSVSQLNSIAKNLLKFCV